MHQAVTLIILIASVGTLKFVIALVCYIHLPYCDSLSLSLYQCVTVIFAIASDCYFNLRPLLGVLDLPLTLHWLLTLNCSLHQFVTLIFVLCTGLLDKSLSLHRYVTFIFVLCTGLLYESCSLRLFIFVVVRVCYSYLCHCISLLRLSLAFAWFVRFAIIVALACTIKLLIAPVCYIYLCHCTSLFD